MNTTIAGSPSLFEVGRQLGSLAVATLLAILLLLAGCQTQPGAVGYPESSAGGTTPARAVIKIDGMACPFCTYNIQRQLERVAGVERADVSLERSEAYVTLTRQNPATATQLREAVESAGFTPTEVQMP